MIPANWSLAALGCALALAGCATPTASGPAGPPGTAAPESFLRTNAGVAVVSFFDMYCSHCQAIAPRINDLHRQAQGRWGGSKVQFYAVGWGNTPLESEKYRTRFNVPFPVIPDKDLAISSRYGKFRPPLLIVLKKQGGAWVETYRTKDLRGDPAAILAQINP